MRVAEQHPEAILALVGRVEDPWASRYADGLDEHLLRSGMHDRVLVKPVTSSPYEWHLAADVLVCASDNESMPRVILEAMAFETVVVSTDIFGVPEVVEDGVTGFLFPSRDEQAMAQKLNDVLADLPAHTRIREAAAAHVRRRHDADSYAAAFEDLIAQVLDERRAPTSIARRPTPGLA